MPAQLEWLTKAQAAKRLKMSVRSVQTMVAAKKIQSKLEVDPAKKNQHVTLLHAGDVERIAYERQHPEQKAVQPAQGDESRTPLHTPAKAQSAPSLTVAALLNALAASFPRLLPPGETTAEKPWLTLDEAEAYSGLPAGFLRLAIEDRRLRALDVGIRKGGRWRVAREDLMPGQLYRQAPALAAAASVAA